MKVWDATLPPALSEAVKACKNHLVAAGIFSALINILYLAPTIYMMQVYDRVVPTGGIVTLVWITVVVAVAIGTLAALEAVRARLMVRASLRLDRLLSGIILDRLLAESGNSPRTGQVLRDFDVVRQTFGGQAMTALFDAPWTPIYFLVAFIIHPVLGALVLLGGVLLVGVAVANERWTKHPAEDAHSAVAASYALQDGIMRRSEVVRALGMRRALVSRQLRERSVGMALVAESQFVGARFTSIAKFLRLFLQSLALGVAAWLAVNRQISVGAIIAASVLLSRGLQPIELLIGSWKQILQAREALKTLSGLLLEEGAAASLLPLPAPRGAVSLESIFVRGTNEQSMILRGISMEVAAGEMLGVIGPSGAGKTTLARVLGGALRPDAGTARIDGAKYEDWDADLLAQHIGYMPQDPSLLPGTIAENISRFSAADDGEGDQLAERVVAAAMAAGTHELILRLPQGYNTVLGPAGQGLSAGQAQRVALARALFGDPTLIVMDEPNAALDAEGEASLCVALSTARNRGATIIVVAHRVGILGDADKLAIIREGTLARIGPAAEILTFLRGGEPVKQSERGRAQP